MRTIAIPAALRRHRQAVTTLIVAVLGLTMIVGVSEVAGAHPADTAKPIGHIDTFVAGKNREVTVSGWAYQPGAGSTSQVHVIENRWHYQAGPDPKASIHTMATLYRPDVSRARHTQHTHTGFRIVVGRPHGLGYGTDRICIDIDVHVHKRLIVTHLPCRVFTFTAPLTQNHKVLALARTFMNGRYHYVTNAAGPRSFDCSGFVQYVYRRATGRTLYHGAEGQYLRSKHIATPQPGDLVFYLDSSHHAFHVGIYAGRQNYRNRGVVRPVMAAAIDHAEGVGYQAMSSRNGARYIAFGTYTH